MGQENRWGQVCAEFRHPATRGRTGRRRRRHLDVLDRVPVGPGLRRRSNCHSRQERKAGADYQVVELGLFRQFQEDGKWMMKNKQLKVYNDEQWGMNQQQFEETAL